MINSAHKRHYDEYVKLSFDQYLDQQTVGIPGCEIEKFRFSSNFNPENKPKFTYFKSYAYNDSFYKQYIDTSLDIEQKRGDLSTVQASLLEQQKKYRKALQSYRATSESSESEAVEADSEQKQSPQTKYTPIPSKVPVLHLSEDSPEIKKSLKKYSATAVEFMKEQSNKSRTAPILNFVAKDTSKMTKRERFYSEVYAYHERLYVSYGTTDRAARFYMNTFSPDKVYDVYMTEKSLGNYTARPEVVNRYIPAYYPVPLRVSAYSPIDSFVFKSYHPFPASQDRFILPKVCVEDNLPTSDVTEYEPASETIPRVRGGIPFVYPNSVSIKDLIALSSTQSKRLTDLPFNLQVSTLVRYFRLASIPIEWNCTGEELEKIHVMKVKIMLDIADYIPKTNIVLDDTLVREAMAMVTSTIFRTFNKEVQYRTEGEEEGIPSDPAWPFLRWVYEFFLRFIISDVDNRILSKYVDDSFILKFVELFNAPDRRERSFLKTILHKIYAKFTVLRRFIRHSINNTIQVFIYGSEDFNGVAELLDILGSIINGFTLPLKAEHRAFFTYVLSPLFKVRTLGFFHQQLSYCISQFLQRDKSLGTNFLSDLLRYWPVTNPYKEVIFIMMLEEVLSCLSVDSFRSVVPSLFCQIGQCIASTHFQVSDRAVHLVVSDHFHPLAEEFQNLYSTYLLPALLITCDHWSPLVVKLAHSALLQAVPLSFQMSSETLATSLKKEKDDLSLKAEHDAHFCRYWKELKYLYHDTLSQFPRPIPRDSVLELPNYPY